MRHQQPVYGVLLVDPETDPAGQAAKSSGSNSSPAQSGVSSDRDMSGVPEENLTPLQEFEKDDSLGSASLRLAGDLEPRELEAEAESLKEKGNILFKLGDTEAATEIFMRVLKGLEPALGVGEAGPPSLERTHEPPATIEEDNSPPPDNYSTVHRLRWMSQPLALGVRAQIPPPPGPTGSAVAIATPLKVLRYLHPKEVPSASCCFLWCYCVLIQYFRPYSNIMNLTVQRLTGILYASTQRVNPSL